jgi:predicted kinase
LFDAMSPSTSRWHLDEALCSTEVHHRGMRPATDIDIPDPCLVVLVGAAGVGKSTFAARHFASTEILSSDGFRAAISGDEADQSVSRVAFAALYRALEERLANGILTVVDATSVRRVDRRALIGRADAARVPAVAIVLDLPIGTILARNAGRTRVVDEAVIQRQHVRLRAALGGGDRAIDHEGFSTVIVLEDGSLVDRFRIRRES